MALEISSFKNIVVLTGAGISAESGIATFRDSDGLWEKHRIEDVATPEAFTRDPVLVWRFYSQRRRDAASVSPNAAHLTLARVSLIGEERAGSFTLVTQNVDGLHERALDHLLKGDTRREPSRKPEEFAPLSMHGTLSKSRCSACDAVFSDICAWFSQDGTPTTDRCTSLLAPGNPALDPSTVRRDSDRLPLSPCCNARLRPHIVWFGEMPLHLDRISSSVSRCDLFVTIGSSGQVYPAAGFIDEAKCAGAVTVCLNKERLERAGMIDFFFEGPASKLVPEFFEKLLTS